MGRWTPKSQVGEAHHVAVKQATDTNYKRMLNWAMTRAY